MRKAQSSPEERAYFISKYEQSQMSQEAFARSHHLNVATFRKWLYDSRKPSQEIRFVEVQTSPLPTNLPQTRVHLPWGVVLEFETPPSAEYIVELLCELGRHHAYLSI